MFDPEIIAIAPRRLSDKYRYEDIAAWREALEISAGQRIQSNNEIVDIERSSNDNANRPEQ